MRLPKFTYYRPSSVEEAVGTLAQNPGSRALAGGTDLLVNMKLRVETPETLVGLQRVAGLQGATHEGGRTVIGARTTLRKQIQTDAFLLERYPAVVQAAERWDRTGTRPWALSPETSVRTLAADSSTSLWSGAPCAPSATRRGANSATS